MKQTRAALGLLALLAGCETPGVSFESAFPPVVCEAGGQRRVRVYGHGFEEGTSIEATFGGLPATVSRVDDYTLDVYLPDLAVAAESFPWDPHDLYTGQLGLYAYQDGALAPVAWNVQVPRSQLDSSGAPAFKDQDEVAIRYQSFEVEALVVGYEEVDDGAGGVVTVPVTLDGPFNFGYFASENPWVDANGDYLGTCIDGVDRYIGDYCYEPLYYTEGGQPLLYDASDFAYFGMSEATGDPSLYASWDPYLYKGALYVELDGEYHVFYYDGRSNETDYAPGDLFNQSFGVFFTLSPVYVYTDGAGEVVRSEEPLDGDPSLSFWGIEAGSIDHTFFPGILPITETVGLDFRVGSAAEVHTLQRPLGVISHDFDYSLFYTDAPYYTFTGYKDVDLDGDGVDDDVIPADGSWGCVWLAQ